MFPEFMRAIILAAGARLPLGIHRVPRFQVPADKLAVLPCFERHLRLLQAGGGLREVVMGVGFEPQAIKVGCRCWPRWVLPQVEIFINERFILGTSCGNVVGGCDCAAAGDVAADGCRRGTTTESWRALAGGAAPSNRSHDPTSSGDEP